VVLVRFYDGPFGFEYLKSRRNFFGARSRARDKSSS